MKKIMFGILAIFLLSIVAVSAAPLIVGTIPDQTRDEDCLPWDLDLSDYESGDAGETDLDLDWSVIGVDPLLFSASFDTDLNIITFTPVAEAFGSDTITLTLTNGTPAEDVTQDIVVTLNSVNDDPWIVGTIPAQNKLEDAAAWKIYLTGNEDDIEDSGTKLKWSVSGVDTSLINVVVTDDLNDEVTFTPVADAFGSDEVTFTLTDSNGGTDTQDVVITLTSNGNDDAPVLTTSIPDQKWTKGEVHTLDLKNYFSDPDDPTGLSLIYAWEADPELLEDITLTQASGVVTFTPVVDSWKGSHYINFTASDGVHDIVKDSDVKLVIRNKPDFICKDGEIGDLVIDSISDPDDGDEFKPGETIKVKLKVENNHDEDNLDVTVEAFLYDETDDSIVESFESDAEEIKDGKEETIEFELLIPLDADIDEDHDYKLLLKVYEDGNEDEHCVESAEIDLDITREEHDVIVSNVDLTPTLVNPGETIEFVVDVENIGSTDEDDVVIKVKNNELGLDLASNKFDLDDATGDDYDKTERFVFTVPSNIPAGTYYVEVGVYDEDDDLFDESNDAQLQVPLVVSGEAFISTEEVEISVSDIPDEVDPGKSYSVPVKITNNKDVQDTFTVKLTNIDDWATSTSQKVLTLKSGQSETVYMYFKANEEIGEGKYSATVEIKDSIGNMVGSETVTIGAEEEVKWYKGSNLFWIIGYVVLIVVLVFFIKMIVSRGKKKGKVKEVRL